MNFDAGSYREGTIDLPRIDGIAARDKDGHLWLAVTNLDPERTGTISVTFDGLVAKSAQGEVLTGPQVNSVNSFDNPDVVAPRPISGKPIKGGITLELPPKSVAVVQVGE